MTSILKLDQETLGEIERYRQLGLTLLELDEQVSPVDVVTRIDRTIYQLRSGSMGELDDIIETEQEQIIALGVLLGEQYIRAMNWHWAEIQQQEEETAHTRVLNKDNTIAINPIGYLDELLRTDTPTMILTHFYSATMGRLPSPVAESVVTFF